MVERFEPGKNLPDTVTPIRDFVRKTLFMQGESNGFVKSSVEFADAAYYIKQNIGDPAYHLKLANKKAKKNGLSEEEIERAIQTAQGAFAAYLELEGNPKVPEVVDKILAIKETVIKERKQEQARIRLLEKKTFLRAKLQQLMNYSDTQISILNANPRIDFSSDPVYPELDAKEKAKMKTRTFTKVEYEKKEADFTEREKQLVIKIKSGYNMSRLADYTAGIRKNLPLRKILGEEKFEKLVEHVLALTSGSIVSRDQVLKDGLQPEEILTLAKGTLRNFYITEAEGEQTMRHRPYEIGVRTKRGTDPSMYLMDGSHRKSSYT